MEAAPVASAVVSQVANVKTVDDRTRLEQRQRITLLPALELMLNADAKAATRIVARSDTFALPCRARSSILAIPSLLAITILTSPSGSSRASSERCATCPSRASSERCATCPSRASSERCATCSSRASSERCDLFRHVFGVCCLLKRSIERALGSRLQRRPSWWLSAQTKHRAIRWLTAITVQALHEIRCLTMTTVPCCFRYVSANCRV